jgi:hypothetical protein
MKRNVAKLSVAALAGASCLLSSHAAQGAVTVVGTKVASSVAFSNGTYDVIDFDLTGLTGIDATAGGSGQDPEVFELSGAFTAVGGQMALVGANATTEGANFLLAKGQTYTGPGTLHSSYVPFVNDVAATVVGATGASKSGGSATSISDTWYTTPAVKSGQGGGVEPGVDATKSTVASQSSSDPYANNGLLAEILVTPGAAVNYSGLIFDYGAQTGEPISFSYPAVTGSGTGTGMSGGTNKIVSLVTTGAPTGTEPNGYGTAPLGTLTVTNSGGTSGKYFPGYLNITGGATAGYVAVQGFLPGDVPEVYALQVAIGGVVLAQNDTRLAAIIADIDGSSSNVSTGGVTTVAGSPYASLFPGYDIIVPTSIAGGSSPYFAFDFSNADGTDSDSATGQVTVTSIAAVPEPATAAGLVLGAAGLLLGRRKNRVQAV